MANVGGPATGPAERALSLKGLVRGTGGGAWRGRLPHNEADEPETPAPRPPPAEWRRSVLKPSLN